MSKRRTNWSFGPSIYNNLSKLEQPFQFWKANPNRRPKFPHWPAQFARPFSSTFSGRFRTKIVTTTTIRILSFRRTKPTQELPCWTTLYMVVLATKFNKFHLLYLFSANPKSGDLCHHLGFVAHHSKSKTRPLSLSLDLWRRRGKLHKFWTPAAFTGEIDCLPSIIGLPYWYESCSSFKIYLPAKFGRKWS